MQLVMYIGNDFIASASVIKQKISEPGYVSSLKRRLMQENSEVVQAITVEPEFLLLNPSSSFHIAATQSIMNRQPDQPTVS